MKIYNTTTKREVQLTIIDGKTGTEYTQDLIGNCDDLHYNSDLERYEMDQDGIDWWSNAIDGLENIDRLQVDAKELLPFNEYEELEERIAQEGDACDLERHITVITTLLEQVIAESK